MSLDYLASLTFGHVGAQVVHTATRLGVPDALARGPRPAADLAAELHCDATAVARLLRAMAVLGLVEEVGGGGFVLAERAQALRADHPQSLRATVLLQADPALWQAWGGLADAVRAGATAFDEVHSGPLFEHLAADPDLAAVFDAAMDAGTRALARRIVLAHDFTGSGVVVDVGGGRGAMLARILQDSPDTTGVLLDRAEVVAAAAATFRAAGVADRVEVRAGDFFTAVPAGDVLVVQGILHDWDDERCLTVLRNCRRAIADGGRLLVVEPVLPDALAGPEAREVVMSDLAMLVCTGGCERSRAQYDALFVAGGFTPAAVTGPLPGSATRILVARPA